MSDNEKVYYVHKYPVESFWSRKTGVCFELRERVRSIYHSDWDHVKMKDIVWYSGDDEDFKKRCHIVSKEMDDEMKRFEEIESHRVTVEEEALRKKHNEQKRLLDLCECTKVKNETR